MRSCLPSQPLYCLYSVRPRLPRDLAQGCCCTEGGKCLDATICSHHLDHTVLCARCLPVTTTTGPGRCSSEHFISWLVTPQLLEKMTDIDFRKFHCCFSPLGPSPLVLWKKQSLTRLLNCSKASLFNRHAQTLRHSDTHLYLHGHLFKVNPCWGKTVSWSIMQKCRGGHGTQSP